MIDSLCRRIISSPIGRLGIDVDARGALVGIVFGAAGEEGAGSTPAAASRCDRVVRQLDEYFEGRRRTFDLDLNIANGTEFQQAVWSELCRIPFGETVTYRELAIRVGRPAAIRAAGSANGANPIPIVIPCHRVIGSDGTLTGYGGGLDRKRALLEMEMEMGNFGFRISDFEFKGEGLSGAGQVSDSGRDGIEPSTHGPLPPERPGRGAA